MARDTAELLEMGARIKELREAHGLKQQWIADQVGVTLRTYQNWQAGASPPEQENLEKLAGLFGVTPKYILKGETPTPIASDDLGRRLDAIDQRLATIEHQLAQLLGTPEEDEELGELGGLIVRTIEQALSPPAPAAGQPPPTRAPRPGRARPARRAQDAA